MSVYQASSQIHIRKMPQLAEAVDREDDWTGITDAATRRKIQNRLNVRAYRRRKSRALQLLCTSASTSITEPEIPCWVEDRQAVVYMPASVASTFISSRGSLIPTTPSPAKSDRIIFPLSSDHLITLLQFNVLRGLLLNRQLLSCLQPSTSPHAECSAGALHVLPDLNTFSLSSVPPSLCPTILQRTVAHEEWIDIIPHPLLRDNLIRTSGKFDEDELWSDTVGGLFEGFPASDVEQRGVVMWSPPWHVSGWEISEGFWRKWGWSLKGCREILDATNLRRMERGEEPFASEF